MERKAKEADKVRHRRPRADIREELLKSALIEFGAKGFDGASTRAIAARIQAHQPQINYHFESKAALWRAAVDYLFGLMAEKLWGVLPPMHPTSRLRTWRRLLPSAYGDSCPSLPSTLSSTKSW